MTNGILPISSNSGVENQITFRGKRRMASTRLPFSRTTTERPDFLASIAQESPDGPPPTTIMSNIRVPVFLHHTSLQGNRETWPIFAPVKTRSLAPAPRSNKHHMETQHPPPGIHPDF